MWWTAVGGSMRAFCPETVKMESHCPSLSLGSDDDKLNGSPVADSNYAKGQVESPACMFRGGL